MTTVHLIDACPWVFRAWYSLPDTLTTPEGQPANALRGFVNLVLQYLRQQRPTHVGLAFDESLSTSFRNDLYPAYKSRREPAPPELEAQLRWCREFGVALGLPTWAHPRYEADDLIASAARPLRAQGCNVIVVTSDKDLCQLVDRGLHVVDTGRGRRFDEGGVAEHFGVRPAQIPDFLGLAGDAVDDIPGVPGVGPKSAVALLSAYAHLEQAYDDLDGVAELPVRGAKSLARKLGEHREQAFLCRELATLSLEAPVDTDLDTLQWRGPTREFEPLMERLGLASMLRGVPQPAGAAEA